jgi:hypothetical protein
MNNHTDIVKLLSIHTTRSTKTSQVITLSVKETLKVMDHRVKNQKYLQNNQLNRSLSSIVNSKTRKFILTFINIL